MEEMKKVKGCKTESNYNFCMEDAYDHCENISWAKPWARPVGEALTSKGGLKTGKALTAMKVDENNCIGVSEDFHKSHAYKLCASDKENCNGVTFHKKTDDGYTYKHGGGPKVCFHSEILPHLNKNGQRINTTCNIRNVDVKEFEESIRNEFKSKGFIKKFYS